MDSRRRKEGDLSLGDAPRPYPPGRVTELRDGGPSGGGGRPGNQHPTRCRQWKGAPPYDTSERPRGGLRLRLPSVARAKPPCIGVVSSKSAANRTGSIGQYGAESQVVRETRAKQD